MIRGSRGSDDPRGIPDEGFIPQKQTGSKADAGDGARAREGRRAVPGAGWLILQGAFRSRWRIVSILRDSFVVAGLLTGPQLPE